MKRFWNKVDRSGGLFSCWLWTAATNRHGYGMIRVNGQLLRAPRVAYELLVGPIPPGLQIDHLCRVRACVNPSHLEPVTQKENILRGESPAAHHARKTQCAAGHSFDAANTYYPKRGGRQCRVCRATAQRAYLVRRKKVAR